MRDYKITYNGVKNNILVKFYKMPYGEKLGDYSRDMCSTFTKTKKGYTVLFDLLDTDLDIMTLDDVQNVKEVQAKAIETGLGKFAYATTNRALEKQMKRSFKNTNGVADVFDNIKNANEFLGL